MKEEIRFRCGHLEEVELPNDGKAASSMRQRMEQRSCQTCDYQEKVEMAKQRAREWQLISLRGTPRQVAYGNLLRSRQVELFLRTVELARRAEPKEQWAEFLQQRLFSIVNTLPEAGWWIEHQSLQALQSLLGNQWREEPNDE